MLYDTLGVLKLDHLPDVSDPRVAVLVYLGQEFEGYAPGFYKLVDGEWSLLGGAGAATEVIETTETQTINLADFNPDGLLLSVLVTRNTSEDREISLIRTDTEEVLEEVPLSDTYTTISIPQPHKLYSLVVEANLTVNIKTI